VAALQRRARPLRHFPVFATRPRDVVMDLPNSVALSTLPGISRTRAASVFKALRDAGRFDVTLEEIVAVCSPRAPVEAVAAEARRRGGARPRLCSSAPGPRV